MRNLKMRGTICIAFILVMLTVFSLKADAITNFGDDDTADTYRITPDSETFEGRMSYYSTYNEFTKHYYLIRSYLEQLENQGGGTLVLGAGVYSVSNTLYVSSGVTLEFEDGVTIMKGSETGNDQFTSATSIFQLVRPSNAYTDGVYSAYGGESDINFIGKGNVTFDLNFYRDSIAIIAGHNSNLKIDNIDFKNMNSGHFIEIDATKNAVISNCSFMYSKVSANVNKEAINIDTPDKATKGWSQKWSSYDKTPNDGLLIENNSFFDLDRAIGTHKYSGDKYHNNIVIQNNRIEKMRSDAIRIMNWSNPVIKDNTFKNIAGGKKFYRGILASGTKNPTFYGNTFEKVSRPIQFMAWKNEGPGSEYSAIYNELSGKNKKDLKKNKAIKTDEKFIRIYKYYNNFSKGLEKIYLNKN